MKRILSIMAFVFCFYASNAQDEKVELEKVPVNIAEAFKTKYPVTTDQKWTRDRKKNYTVQFKVNDLKCRAWYNKEAVWGGGSFGMKFDELPQAVKDGFAATECKDWKLIEVFRNENGYDTVYFITVKNKEKRILSFGADGKLKKTE